MAMRRLPQIDKLAGMLETEAPHALKVQAARAAVTEASRSISQGAQAPTIEELQASAADALTRLMAGGLTTVINATGVLLHTNLGRALLPGSSSQAIASAATTYSDLEFDLSSMSRGSRYDAATERLTSLLGAESALVVNNNAAAVLLCLDALGRDKEVVVSRGEMVEIGGGFRIPEIMALSGALLKEVGTTNRTNLKDYEQAIGDRTSAMLKVHPSNYRVVGFTSSVDAGQLGALAESKGLGFIYDIGSGLVTRRVGGQDLKWLDDEPTISEGLEAGAGLVTFSGDKLFGGPQCGIIVGRTALIDILKSSPLLRALRVDKLTIAALGSVLDFYLDGKQHLLPFWKMAIASVDEIRSRAISVCEGMPAGLDIVDGHSTTGGGSAPGTQISSVLIEVSPSLIGTEGLRAALGKGDPPIISRIVNDKVVIDLRTVLVEQDQLLRKALHSALQ
ncbi:MAG: L-seryl-tRNA(Sec) selenium transferase [Actinobacteria bacterium]|nr:L-seryl-tRNA(Sec) selenium transferase [Actinomycetota bacterium]